MAAQFAALTRRNQPGSPLAEGRIRAADAAVTALGGKILEGIHSIGPHGFRAIVLDSEGNRLALHSMTDR